MYSTENVLMLTLKLTVLIGKSLTLKLTVLIVKSLTLKLTVLIVNPQVNGAHC